jgi:L-threonylcarbamoyladenylate synthase
VLKGLAGRIDMVLDGGPCPGGLESTVVDVTGPAVRLLRPGLISAPMLEDAVGPLASRESEHPSSVARSPGQMAKHYSPRTPLVLAEDADAEHQRLREAGLRVVSLTIKENPTEYAAELYAMLHDLDAEGWDRIVVEMPPATPEWAAVRDRLTRAAAGN